MRARCLGNFLREAQRAQIGLAPGSSIEHALTPGKEYVVLGLSVSPPGARNGSGVFLSVCNDWGQYREVSICLFEIVDDRCSRYWRARIGGVSTLILWPDEFYSEFFLDDLSEGFSEPLAIFREVVLRIQAEDAETPSECGLEASSAQLPDQ